VVAAHRAVLPARRAAVAVVVAVVQLAEEDID
jgi:hypothetical protein